MAEAVGVALGAMTTIGSLAQGCFDAYRIITSCLEMGKDHKDLMDRLNAQQARLLHWARTMSILKKNGTTKQLDQVAGRELKGMPEVFNIFLALHTKMQEAIELGNKYLPDAQPKVRFRQRLQRTIRQSLSRLSLSGAAKSGETMTCSGRTIFWVAADRDKLVTLVGIAKELLDALIEITGPAVNMAAPGTVVRNGPGPLYDAMEGSVCGLLARSVRLNAHAKQLLKMARPQWWDFIDRNYGFAIFKHYMRIPEALSKLKIEGRAGGGDDFCFKVERILPWRMTFRIGHISNKIMVRSADLGLSVLPDWVNKLPHSFYLEGKKHDPAKPSTQQTVPEKYLRLKFCSRNASLSYLRIASLCRACKIQAVNLLQPTPYSVEGLWKGWRRVARHCKGRAMFRGQKVAYRTGARFIDFFDLVWFEDWKTFDKFADGLSIMSKRQPSSKLAHKRAGRTGHRYEDGVLIFVWSRCPLVSSNHPTDLEVAVKPVQAKRLPSTADTEVLTTGTEVLERAPVSGVLPCSLVGESSWHKHSLVHKVVNKAHNETELAEDRVTADEGSASMSPLICGFQEGGHSGT